MPALPPSIPALSSSEPVFLNLLKCPGIDSQPGGSVRQPYLTYRPVRLCSLAESIHWNRFLGSLNDYKYGLCMHTQSDFVFLPCQPFFDHLLFFSHSQLSPDGLREIERVETMPYSLASLFCSFCVKRSSLLTTFIEPYFCKFYRRYA